MTEVSWDGENQGGELFKWDKVGQKVTGLYTSRRSVRTKLGEMTVYDLITKDGEIAVPGTKGLNDTMKRYPADGSLIIEIEFTEEKKGNFPNPFKVFTVRYAKSTQEKLTALGITIFGAAEISDEQKAAADSVKKFDAENAGAADKKPF